MTVFADRGHAVTVAEITQAAGVSKGTFYVYFASKTELIAALRDVLIAEHHAGMAKAIADSSPISSAVPFSRDVVGVSIDFLASELHSVLFPSAADQAQGEAEVVRGFEEFLIDAEQQGNHRRSGPLLVRRPARGSRELRRPLQPGSQHLRSRRARRPRSSSSSDARARVVTTRSTL